ncbi:MAG: hypothetical protein CMJ39_08365 [Phycisphaerae bacterium]|nr:hypothetical protein [Phycisphaerae bacterium]
MGRSFSAIVGFICCTSVILPLVACQDEDVSPRQSSESVAVEIKSSIRLPIPEEAPVVRVRLMHVVGNLEPVVFAKDGASLRIEDDHGNNFNCKGPVTIHRDQDGWLIRCDQKVPDHIHASNSLNLSSADGIEMTDDSNETRRYGGIIQCLAVPDDQKIRWDVIEHLSIEDYLPGVLAGELYAHWGKQCQAAQAIAARSFVSMSCAERTGRRWDVVDTPASQAYVGQVVDPLTHQAVSMTKGMILTWGKELVPGYFSSCCGGRAATATEAIGPNPINSVKPLNGHGKGAYCQDAPLYEWERTVDGSELASAIREHVGKESALSGIQDIRSIRIVENNQHGRGVRLSLKDSSGRTHEMTAAALAQYSGALPKGALYSGWVEGQTKSGSLHLSGRGYGHGAGLCQYGAAAMADQGKSFWQIIEFYYPQAEIKKAW